jgi:iron complex transport system substrate-binding protein
MSLVHGRDEEWAFRPNKECPLWAVKAANRVHVADAGQLPCTEAPRRSYERRTAREELWPWAKVTTTKTQRRMAHAVLFALATLMSPAHADEPPRRIVSINLCADQYLLALAKPSQILALSPAAKDASLSYMAAAAQPFATVADDAESVLILKPDMVIASVYNRPETLARLRRLRIPVVTMKEADTLPAIREQMLWAGRLLHREDAAARLTARFDETVRASAGHWRGGKTALYYEHGGFTTGAASFIHALMVHTGLADAAERPGFVPLEMVIARHPDFLVLQGAGAADQGSAMLDHPALARLYPPSRRIMLPANETLCPGPGAIAALNDLTAAGR